MKKSLLALAALGAMASTAHAQSSVTLWGNIDAGLMYSHTSGASNTLSYQDSQVAPTVFGMKGSEDLGAGLKAGFALTGGFSSGNGMSGNQASGRLFGREANVWLSGNYGKITLGLQLDPALLASIPTEPRGAADSLSFAAPWIGATLTNAGVNQLAGGLFDSNSISYTYSGNGLYFGALHAFGGQAGSNTKASGNSVGINYSNSGFTISGGYAGLNGTTSGNTVSQILNIGLGYAYGPFAVRGQYADFKSQWDTMTPLRVKGFGIGVDYATSPANKLNLSYYNLKDAASGYNGTTNKVILMDTYSLSKRTSVFGQVGYVKAATGTFGGAGGSAFDAYVNGVAGGTPNSSSYLLGVGLNHSF